MPRPKRTKDHAALAAEDEIVRVLQWRRAEFDKEIADFKNLKDMEFTKFENELREAASTGISRNDTSSDHGVAVNGETITGPISKPEHPTSFQELAQGRSGNKPNDHKPKTPERELALFVPSYLPLLEAPREIVNKSPLPTKLSDHRHKRHTGPSSLSPSFTLSSAAYNPLGSPAESPRLPSSVPRPGLADRRSSLQFDTSSGFQNLRSSLRQPRSLEESSPKASKHVLFSINDMVISPSSSPVARRSEFEAAQPEGKTIPQGLPIPANVVEQNAVAPKANAIIGPSPPPTPRSYRDLVEPTRFTPPEASEEADFEMNAGGDPLFDFGEDLPPLEEETEDEPKETLKEDEELDEPQPPRVGSLPIEIRRPGKRDG